MNSPDGHTSAEDGPGWFEGGDAALLTDLYQLTMLQAYWAEEMQERAVFSLFYRTLPKGRNYLLACGLDTVLGVVEELRFDAEARRHLTESGELDPDFIESLADFRFTGDIRAVPEGTPIFPDEPLLEVEAPIAEAQLIESIIMNQVHMQTVLASKAVRVKRAAGDRTVVDFGLRRMHGADAALKAARAFHIAGVDATSNVLAGKIYGVPVTGTMAHSYIEAHDDELDAFRAFASSFPDTVLLVDTYDTLEGVRKVIHLAEELGDGFRVRGIRLDSGDLGELARSCRALLDSAGLGQVEIFASGGLDEWKIRRLLADGAPIDGFGVGTQMGVARDAPALDMAYKLTSYGGEGRLKLSSGKSTLPGRKQVFRQEDDRGRARGDVIARADESLSGRPLLRKVMEGGERLPEGAEGLELLRRRAARETASLPDRILALEEASSPYGVTLSEELERFSETTRRRIEAEETE